MSRIIIDGITEDELAALDKDAALAGMTRTEYMKSRLFGSVTRRTVNNRERKPVTVDDFRKLAELLQDLHDPDVVATP